MESNETDGVADPWRIALLHQGLVRAYLSKNKWLMDKSCSLDYDDYFQIGVMAIYDSAKKFNALRGKFSSYAYINIKGRIMRAYKNQAFQTIKIPEKKHVPRNIPLENLNSSQRWMYNAINKRANLSCCINLGIKQTHHEDSEMFVFFD